VVFSTFEGLLRRVIKQDLSMQRNKIKLLKVENTQSVDCKEDHVTFILFIKF